jgi:GntR family transcriptional regulator, rspAB operon transcriptional repressor
MKLTKVIRREPLRQQVLASLREALTNGKLLPAQRLTEEGVAEFLGVSRTPAREALAILHEEGALVRRVKGGFEVSVPTMEKIEQIFQIRHLLEPFAVRLAAMHAKPADVERLNRILAAERENIDAESQINYLGPDRELRREIFKLSGNDQLVDCIARYEDHLKFVAALTLRDPIIREIAFNSDKPIVDAVAAHDPDAAEVAVHRQLDAARTALTEILQKIIADGNFV